MLESLPVIAGLGCLGYAALSVYARTDSTISPEASKAREIAGDIVKRAANSKSLFGMKSALIEELHVLQQECANADWDGHGAFALNPVAIARAEDLILALPDGFPLPECAPEPDGSVSLDWIVSRYRVFSLSVASGDRMAYAWLDGTERGHGVARLDGLSLPERILRELRAMLNHGADDLRAA